MSSADTNKINIQSRWIFALGCASDVGSFKGEVEELEMANKTASYKSYTRQTPSAKLLLPRKYSY
jgi:hypothetical protein